MVNGYFNEDMSSLSMLGSKNNVIQDFFSQYSTVCTENSSTFVASEWKGNCSYIHNELHTDSKEAWPWDHPWNASNPVFQTQPKNQLLPNTLKIITPLFGFYLDRSPTFSSMQIYIPAFTSIAQSKDGCHCLPSYIPSCAPKSLWKTIFLTAFLKICSEGPILTLEQEFHKAGVTVTKAFFRASNSTICGLRLSGGFSTYYLSLHTKDGRLHLE